MSPRDVVILGAGVIGLQTAVTLLEAGHKVHIVAEYLPGDNAPHYTSPRAGAIWRTHAPASEMELRDWDEQTYRAWMELVKKEEAEGRKGESGLALMPAIQYWDVRTPEIEHGASSIWWGPLVLDFAEIPASSLPEGVLFGISYTTFVVNVPQNLSYLQSRVEALGGKIHRFAVPRDIGLQEAASMAIAAAGLENTSSAVLVNATGLGARWLVPDENMYVVQGQTLLVKGESKRHVCRLGKEILDVNVIIPRPGTGVTVVGASRAPDVWRTENDEATVKWLLDGGRKLAPELLGDDGEFEVVARSVGLRPYRKGGPRVETETLPHGQVIIHEYGHAGAGYQNSVGSARKVLRLLEGLD